MPEYRVHLARTVRVHKIVHVVADDEREARLAALRNDDGDDYCDESAGRRRVVSVEPLSVADRTAAEC
jgi:hypothetical protein